MTTRDAIATLEAEPRYVAGIATHCPWCGLELSGEVLVTFHNFKFTALTQTRKIGRRFYIWVHQEDGCHVPSLDRIHLPRRQPEVVPCNP